MLHELVAYADKHLADSEPGFKTREVRWSIELAADSRFLNILPLGDGRRGADLPRCPDMHGMNAGGKSHFLVESAQTVALLFKANEEDKKIAGAKIRHRFYTRLLRDAAQTYPHLRMLADLLENDNRCEEIRAALATHRAKPSDWVTWRIDGHDPRLETEVQAWWRNWRRIDQAGDSGAPQSTKGAAATDPEMMLCLLTGLPAKPLPTHPKITGLSGVGGLAMGDVMVGFDKAAFGSYGLDQSANAAMSAEAAQKYVDGLNDLIRNHTRKLANTLVAHWYKHSLPPEDDPLAFLAGMETDEQSEAVALGAARRLLDAIRAGERPDLADNHYYALTLSGAAGRVMVRDWMEGDFRELAANIKDWFSDLEVVALTGKKAAPEQKLETIVTSLLAERRPSQKYDDWVKPIGPGRRQLVHAAIQHQQLPRLVLERLAALLPTFMSSDGVQKALFPARDRSEDDSVGLTVSRLYARMGLIKAYFIRQKPGGDTTMTAYLNPDHPKPAYHCGRLLAVLANLQRAALGDVGAGVVQRYYAAASQTPGLILGRLASNARNHLGKLEGGLAFWYESEIASVMGKLGDGAPRILDLEGQGLFALGYYQQLAALRGGKKSTNVSELTQDNPDQGAA